MDIIKNHKAGSNMTRFSGIAWLRTYTNRRQALILCMETLVQEVGEVAKEVVRMSVIVPSGDSEGKCPGWVSQLCL